jgi:hypothetical protein
MSDLSTIRRGARRALHGLLIGMLPLAATLSCATSASAAGAGPAAWRVLSVTNPTNFKPGDESGDDSIIVTAVNVGGSSTGCTAEQIADEPRPAFSPFALCSSGSPVVSPATISDELPAGLTAVQAFGVNAYENPLGQPAAFVTEYPVGSGKFPGEDTGPPYGLSCVVSPRAAHCETGEPVAPGDTLVMTIRVHVSGEVNQANHATVSGGGAPEASVSNAVPISSQPAPYGIANGGVMSALSTTQAGAHPNFTTEFFLNTVNEPEPGQKGEALYVETPQQPKDIDFDLPAGMVGSTVGVARCPIAEVVDEANCPRDSMIGTATVMVDGGAIKPRVIATVPVFNIVPAPGEPAAFALDALFFPVRLDTSLRANGGYVVRVSTPDITGGGRAYMTSITIWGDPAEHNGPGPDAASRQLEGNIFLAEHAAPEFTFGGGGTEKVGYSGGASYETVTDQRVALLTNATQCTTPLTGELGTDSWEEPEEPGLRPLLPVSVGRATGCGLLSFTPSLSLLPDTLEAGAPAGYTLNLNVPQPLSGEPERLGTPDVENVVATLPAGVVLSPSAATGLGSCSTEQFAPQSETPGDCPSDSQIGTVSVKSPAIEEILGGHVYLGSPECEPCTAADAAEGRMVRLFVQIEGEGEDAVIVKLEGHGEINQQTGQITTSFTGLPQLPFSDFKMVLNPGERAALANPRTCGSVATSMNLTPWSTPYTPDATITSPFEIKAGLGGSERECAAPTSRFAPTFTAGTTNNVAGGFSPFTLSFGRSDADEYLSNLQLQMPPGLLGMISKVTLCPEPQAAQGTCSSASLIGEASAEVGPGSEPYTVGGGKVYITGPYRGAPYGLSVVLPATAGPYTLAGTTGAGTVVVRSAITINPQTAVVTVTSDPFPTELDGIPLQIREVNATIGGATGSFTFNPTSCERMEIHGALESVGNAIANLSSSFQDTNCAALKFRPKLTVSLGGRASKANGSSLKFKIAYPKGSMGSEAWFKNAKFEIPKQLPVRLTTLQQACSVATFEKNPASCPVHSLVGYGVVHTPVLSAPLKGPIFLVSHAAEKLPDVVVILQGEGVTVELTGQTFINHKTGVTSETFPTTPDVPFESFEANLPTGPYSQFGVNLPNSSYDFCGRSLKMPFVFQAANGLELREKASLQVTNCASTKAKKARTAVRRKKHSHIGTGNHTSLEGRRMSS